MLVINEKPGALVSGDKFVNLGDWFLVMGTKKKGIVVQVEAMHLSKPLAGKRQVFSFPVNRNLTVHCKCINEHEDALPYMETVFVDGFDKEAKQAHRDKKHG